MNCYHCGKPATKLCDFIIGFEQKGTIDGVASIGVDSEMYTCDRPLCDNCATPIGGLIFWPEALGGPDTEDYCKGHAPVVMAGMIGGIRPITREDGVAAQRRLLLKGI